MKSFILGVVIGVAGWFAFAHAQGPQPPTPCEQQLNSEMFESGSLKQQLASARERLRLAQGEIDALKSAATKAGTVK